MTALMAEPFMERRLKSEVFLTKWKGGKAVKFNPDPVIKSAFRMSKLTKLLQENQDPDVFELIRKESGILAQRAIALWLILNFEE